MASAASWPVERPSQRPAHWLRSGPKLYRESRSMSAASQGHNQFGNLPVWDLDDLYPGKDSPQFQAALAEAKNLASKFEADYKGKLVELTRSGGLLRAIRDSEAMEELGGRIGSFAFLQYAQNTTDP